MDIADTFKQKIEEQVIASMGTLFPAEELRTMIEVAIQKFFKESEVFSISTGQRDYWARSETKDTVRFKISPFEVIVFSKVQRIVSGVVDTYFNEEGEKIKAELTKALDNDGEFQGRASANIATMAATVQRVKTMEAIEFANIQLRADIRNRLNDQNAYF